MAGGALKLGQMRRVGVEIGMDEGGVSLPSCIKIGANEEASGKYGKNLNKLNLDLACLMLAKPN